MSSNHKIIRRRCKSKRGRSRQKSKHQKLQSLGKYVKTFEDNIISYHLKYGFQDQQYFEECINIHFTLLCCPLIISLQPQLNQYLIKEIAVFATGLCIQCQSCKLDNSALYVDTLSDNTLSDLCKEHYRIYTPSSNLPSSSIEAKVEFSKSMLSSFCNYAWYINDKYTCNDCFVKKVAQALQEKSWRPGYSFCCMNGCCCCNGIGRCYCRYYSDPRDMYIADDLDSYAEVQDELVMEKYYFATEYTNKIDVATMKCDNYLGKLAEGKSVRNFQSFKNIDHVQGSSTILKKCKACEGEGINIRIIGGHGLKLRCRLCNGNGSLRAEKKVCHYCKDWDKKKKETEWRWCKDCDNTGFHLVLVSWIDDKPIH